MKKIQHLNLVTNTAQLDKIGSKLGTDLANLRDKGEGIAQARFETQYQAGVEAGLNFGDKDSTATAAVLAIKALPGGSKSRISECKKLMLQHGFADEIGKRLKSYTKPADATKVPDASQFRIKLHSWINTNGRMPTVAEAKEVGNTFYKKSAVKPIKERLEKLLADMRKAGWTGCDAVDEAVKAMVPPSGGAAEKLTPKALQKAVAALQGKKGSTPEQVIALIAANT